MATMKDTVLKFIDRINAHDVNGIMQLMSPAYEFVNSSGERFRDRQFIRETWEAQFRNHPDYTIRVQRVIADEEGVGVFGTASGTYAPDGILREEDRWEVPSAFLVIARDGQVTYFESFADTSIVFAVMQSRSAAGD
ncbi:MAG: nuclear transport factor 2 family protein [Phycisphaerales bacterium]|nr:nuclear transport factor 2 family protein [Phycisphaerales bacterium]